MRATALSVLFALMALTHPARADEQSDAVDKIFQRWDGKASPGMTVAILRDGKPLSSGATSATWSALCQKASR